MKRYRINTLLNIPHILGHNVPYCGLRRLNKDTVKAVTKKQLRKPVRNDTPMSKRLKKYILQRDGYVCLCCGAVDNLTVDHITPRAKGGSNDPDNLQTLCFDCNHSKGTDITDYRRHTKAS